MTSYKYLALKVSNEIVKKNIISYLRKIEEGGIVEENNKKYEKKTVKWNLTNICL